MARYIDADELIDRVRYDCDLGAESTKFGVDAAVIMLINKQPQADVVPIVRGTWIAGKTIGDGFTCSNCGKHYQIYPMKWNGCPMCLADMREVKE